MSGWCPQPPGVYLALFVTDTRLCTTDRKEGFVARKLQRGLSSVETWCERSNIKINGLGGSTFLPVVDRVPSYTEWTKCSICK
jgi:hypothetical protein